jgi:hypothetical protein
VTGLEEDTDYWFAVRAEDSAPSPNEDGNTVELNARTPSWHIEIVADKNYGRGTWLDFGPDGYPAVAYCGGGGGDWPLTFARFDGSNWQMEVVDVGRCQWGHLLFDPEGRPSISYTYVPTESLMFARFNGEYWNFQVVDSHGSWVYDQTLAYGPDGLPAIVFGEPQNGDMIFVRFNGTNWVRETVDSDGDVGAYNSLDFKPDGNPGVSYCGLIDDTYGCVKYAYFDGTDWNPEIVVQGPIHNSGLTSLVFDPASLPVISYCLSGELMVARHDGFDWGIQRVDSGGDNSIAIGRDGEPVIAYQGEDLFFGRFDGSSWMSEAVDEGGDQISLAHDQNGLPAISYRGGGGLKFAWCY